MPAWPDVSIMENAPAIPLREYLEGRIDGLAALIEQRVSSAERAVLIAMDAANKAIGKQEDATERRFEAVNEFRSALNDLVTGMMPRAESEQRHAATREKLDLMVPRAEAEGRWKVNTDKIDHIDNRLTRIEGAGLGVRGTWAVLLGLIGAAIGAVGVATALLR